MALHSNLSRLFQPSHRHLTASSSEGLTQLPMEDLLVKMSQKNRLEWDHIKSVSDWYKLYQFTYDIIMLL